MRCGLRTGAARPGISAVRPRLGGASWRTVAAGVAAGLGAFGVLATGPACAGAPPPGSDAAGGTAADTTAAAPATPTAEGPGAGAGGQTGPGAPDVPPPRATSPGFLDQDDVTVRMAGQALIVDILPMNAEVLALATDDLRTYLQEALRKVPDTVPPDLQRNGTFFLVGFSSTEKEVLFEPTQLQLNSEGRRYWPRYIVPVTAGFGNRVLELFRPVFGVYVYDPGIDLLSTLEFSYGDTISSGTRWRAVVQNVEEARSRARR